MHIQLKNEEKDFHPRFRQLPAKSKTRLEGESEI